MESEKKRARELKSLRKQTEKQNQYLEIEIENKKSEIKQE